MKIIITKSQYKLIKENVSLKEKLLGLIKKVGFKSTTKIVGSLDKTLEILDIKKPIDFLNLFNDLDVIQSEERPSWTLYRYKKGYNIMIHDRESDDVYINYGDIWSVLEQKHLTNYYDISNLIKDWLDDTYDLKRTRPTWVFENFQNWDWMISMV